MFAAPTGRQIDRMLCESQNIAIKWRTHLLCFLYFYRVVQVHTVTKKHVDTVGEEQISYCTKTAWKGGIFEFWLFGDHKLCTFML